MPSGRPALEPGPAAACWAAPKRARLPRIALFARGLAVVEVASTMGAWGGGAEGAAIVGVLAGARQPARPGQHVA